MRMSLLQAQHRDQSRNLSSLFAALKACNSPRDLEKGRALHSALIETGDDTNGFIASRLINMYANCGSLEDAHSVFDRVKHHDVVSWTTLILGYAENGEGALALELFHQMVCGGCTPDALSFVAALKACLCLRNELVRGMAVHSLAVTNGWDSDLRVANTLMYMYIRSGDMPVARRVFETMKHPNAVSWNALMFGYADNGEGDLALNVFSHMQCEGCDPSVLTFVAALKACSNLALKEGVSNRLLKAGKAIHLQVVNTGYGSDYRVTSSLVDMYAKCGSLEDARSIFDKLRQRDVVTYTALILGYADNGKGVTALELFANMDHERPDALTFVAALKACCALASEEAGECINGKSSPIKLKSLLNGMAVHSKAACSECISDAYVVSGLVDMYAKCGSMPDAQHSLDRSSKKHYDVVSWNALLFGYVDNGDGEAALEMFTRMKHEGCTPVALTFVAALKACILVGALDMGRRLNMELCRHGFHTDATLETCLVDFYAKCGSMAEAQEVFDASASRHLDTWNALMAGYSHHGDSDRVFELFGKMRDRQMQPDDVTFVCILAACRHAGHVDKGREMFELMSSKYGIEPGVEHYTSLVDILGRANKLYDAVTLAKSIPQGPSAVAWTAVLAACLKWKNVELGKLAFDVLVDCNDGNAGATYVLMSNIYKSKGMHQDQATTVAGIH